MYPVVTIIYCMGSLSPWQGELQFKKKKKDNGNYFRKSFLKKRVTVKCLLVIFNFSVRMLY